VTAIATQGAQAVRLTGVSKVFGRGPQSVVALDQVSLTVAPGEFICLIGASGCGKSTLLNLVAGLEQPSAGTVSVSARQVAMMFQEPALFPWLTAAGNVELALRARKVPSSERRSRVRELLDLVRLGGFGGKRKQTETFYSFTSFTRPATIYRLDLSTFESTLYKAPKLAFNPRKTRTRDAMISRPCGSYAPMQPSHRQ